MEDQRLKTKIVWSLDHLTMDSIHKQDFSQLGIDVLRIVYGRGNRDEIGNFLKSLHSSTKNMLAPAIMVDVSHYLHSKLSHVNISPEVQYEQVLTLSSQAKQGDLSVECHDWATSFGKDSNIYIGFGAVVLKTLSVTAKEVKAQVVQGGTLRAGMNVFDAHTYKEPTVFDLTGVDISPFKNLPVDYVVIPGISKVREVSVIRKKLNILKSDPWLIVRVDNKTVYENLEELLPHIDGVMIPRRELALSMDPALVPIVCKEIMQICHEKAKIAMIESDLLASMRFNPTPTRAEVSDIANAVIDGTDAIVLSEDLALGPYVDRALKACRNIIGDIETKDNVLVNWMSRDFIASTEFEAVAFHAYKTAERVKAKAIVCITRHGNTALRLASFRSQFPIIAVTFSIQTQKRLSLVRGVHSLLLDIDPSIDEVLPQVKEKLGSYSWLKQGDSIVFITVTLSPVALEASNLLTVQHIGEPS